MSESYESLLDCRQNEVVEINGLKFELRPLGWLELEQIKDDCTIITSKGKFIFSQKDYKYKRMVQAIVKHPFAEKAVIADVLKQLTPRAAAELNAKIQEMEEKETEAVKN